ncbi:CAP domain-containing protein [Defluviitalea phaphyphila]|uniref:CAP domain-containing protein n=1 Tax=Defluviitalea phaphyphila TaxID=1473580 RepID=UPI00072FDFD9|nr:CAP domain-containing protein [Defluviitalea phaphyphila]
MKKRLIFFFPLLILVICCIISISSISVNATKYSTFKWSSIKQVEITAYFLNVRTGPNTSYPVIGHLKRGQIVDVIGSLNEWYVVHLPNDSVGVISSKYTRAYSYHNKAEINEYNIENTVPTINNNIAKEEIMLEYINNEREKEDLPPYVMDEDLLYIAKIKAKDMADNNYFSHVSPTYGSPFEMMKKFGISYSIAGENIAGNTSVKNAHDAFMNSPGHRANILSKNYNKIGIGIVPDERYGYIYVQIFKKM